MYDDTNELDYSGDTLPLGQRYAGSRKPSQVLYAMQHDLMWLADEAMEAGFDIPNAYRPLYDAMAYKALCLSNPDLNIVMLSDEELAENDDGDHPLEIEHEMIRLVVDETIMTLNQYAPALTYYGWRSNDPEDDAYELLGVWINWMQLDARLNAGRIVRLDYPEQLTHEWALDQIAGGAEHALWDETGDLSGTLELYKLETLSLLWSA